MLLLVGFANKTISNHEHMYAVYSYLFIWIYCAEPYMGAQVHKITK